MAAVVHNTTGIVFYPRMCLERERSGGRVLCPVIRFPSLSRRGAQTKATLTAMSHTAPPSLRCPWSWLSLELEVRQNGSVALAH